MPTIEPAQLSAAVQDLLAEYGNEVISANEETVQKVAKEVTRDLKKSGSFGGTGEFKKSLGNKIEKTRLSVTASVGSKRLPGLTHLLEFGHAKANGGRVDGFDFVRPVNDTVEDRYMKNMEELLK